MTFVPWTEITHFHNIKKYTLTHSEILNGDSNVLYRAKVKLHGTNASIQIHSDRKVIAQSRTCELVDGNDNYGFAKYVESFKDKWSKIADDTDEEYVIFGEWAGSGIQEGVAISKLTNKVFVVFAARLLSSEDDTLIVEPYVLRNLIEGIPNAYVLPWHTSPIEINWNSSTESLQLTCNLINNLVMEIEKNDPWVEDNFGIKGVGEGLVFYPVSNNHLGLKNFNNLVFKAKGEKHKNIKTASPAQINPEIATNVDKFIDLVLTESRLNQGAAGSYEIKNIGKFLNWIITDVQKETKDELEYSNLTWDQVKKAINNKARNWFLQKNAKV